MLEFISSYTDSYLFQDHSIKSNYMIGIYNKNNSAASGFIKYTLNQYLSSMILKTFSSSCQHNNLSNVVAGLLAPANYQLFVRYFLVFMYFNNAKNIYYQHQNNKTTADSIYNVINTYFESMRLYDEITTPRHIGAYNYGFKINIKKFLTNTLITTLFTSIPLRTQLFDSGDNKYYKDYLDYAVNYIKSTYSHYKLTVLDVEGYINPDSTITDVFI